MIFLCSSALTLMGQYIGDPIDCMVDGIPGGMMDTYCWIHSTFSIPSRWASKIGTGVPHPGVAPVNEEEIKHHITSGSVSSSFYNLCFSTSQEPSGKIPK